jgi:hypothetical protein
MATFTIQPRIPQEAPEMPNYDHRSGAAANRAYSAVNEMQEGILKLQDGADRAEAMKGIAIGKARIANELDQLNLTIADPDEYAVKAREREQAVVDEISNSLARPRAKALFKDSFTEERIQTEGKINRGYILKTHGKQIADAEQGMNQLLESALTAEGQQNQAGIEQMAKDMQSNLVLSGAKKPEEAVKAVAAFRSEVKAQTMNLAAASQPVSFFERYNAGEFRGNNAVDVQRALDIAERSVKARDEKVARDTKWASREAERMYAGLAERHQLDLAELEATAQFYAWEPEKVDNIKRIQIGLRESNPNSDKLIADALDPINKPDPSMADINKASAALFATTSRGVSPDSREYRAAMDKLRSQLRSVRISNNVASSQAERKEAKARTDAKRELSQLMNANEPRLRADRRRQKQGALYDEIDAATDPRAIVQRQRQEYEAKKKETNQSTIDRSEFKSLNR